MSQFRLFAKFSRSPLESFFHILITFKIFPFPRETAFRILTCYLIIALSTVPYVTFLVSEVEEFQMLVFLMDRMAVFK